MATLLVLAANLLPLAGVWFWGWTLARIAIGKASRPAGS